MNQEYKTKWLEALRSGEYKQGMAYLCRDNKFCCLGVLYDIATKNEPEKYQWSDKPYKRDDYREINYYHPTNDEFDTGICLPAIFADNISIDPGATFGKNLESSLWYLNDMKKYSFKEIAYVIKENF